MPTPEPSNSVISCGSVRPGFRPATSSPSSAYTSASLHRAGANRVMQVAHIAALFGQIGDDARLRHQRWFDLALFRIVGADRRDEGAGAHVRRTKERRVRGRACDDHVAGTRRRLGLTGTSTSRPSRPISAANARSRGASLSTQNTWRISSWCRSAASWMRPCAPQPQIVATRDSGSRQIARRDRGRSAGALDGDFDRVEQRDRRAGRGVEQQDRALDRRQAMLRAIVREIAVDLERRVSRTDRKPPGLDVESAALGRDVHRRRRDRSAFGLHPEGIRHGVDVFAERHQCRQVLRDNTMREGGGFTSMRNHLDERVLRRAWTETA